LRGLRKPCIWRRMSTHSAHTLWTYGDVSMCGDVSRRIHRRRIRHMLKLQATYRYLLRCHPSLYSNDNAMRHVSFVRLSTYGDCSVCEHCSHRTSAYGNGLRCALASTGIISQRAPCMLGRSLADEWSTAWRRPLPITPMIIVQLATPTLFDDDGRRSVLQRLLNTAI